jgi:hypothetical protein
VVSECGEYVCVSSGKGECHGWEVTGVGGWNAGDIRHFDMDGSGADFPIVDGCDGIKITTSGAGVEDGDRSVDCRWLTWLQRLASNDDW